MPLPKPHPPSLLGRSVRTSASLPALAPHARPVGARAEPVLRSERASRQLNLPFFAPAAQPGR